MNTDNITSKGITLNENGKLMQIEIYEKQINQLRMDKRSVWTPHQRRYADGK